MGRKPKYLLKELAVAESVFVQSKNLRSAQSIISYWENKTSYKFHANKVSENDQIKITRVR